VLTEKIRGGVDFLTLRRSRQANQIRMLVELIYQACL